MIGLSLANTSRSTPHNFSGRSKVTVTMTTSVCVCVDRVWEKIAESMQLVARNTTGLKAKISQWAKGVGLKGNLQKQLG